MEKDKFTKIIEDMKEARTETRTKVSDEVLFQMATDVYISEFIQTNRQGNKSTPLTSSILLITQPQINLLKRLGYKDKLPLTKSEASRLIDELKKR